MLCHWLKESSVLGAEQDIMGDIFSLGFGPFRWVCTSGAAEDLAATDRIAQRVMEDIMKGQVIQNQRIL